MHECNKLPAHDGHVHGDISLATVASVTHVVPPNDVTVCSNGKLCTVTVCMHTATQIGLTMHAYNRDMCST